MALIPRELYKQCVELLPIPTVDVVIFSPQKNEVLLCKRTNEPAKDFFYTPGGRQQKGELIVETAQRILQAEMGVALKPAALWWVSAIDEIFTTSAFYPITAHCINNFFGCVLSKETALQLDKQHSEFLWFAVDDADIHHYVREKITRALAAAPTPA